MMSDDPVVILVDFPNHDLSEARTEALKPRAEEFAEAYVDLHRLRLARLGVTEMIAE